MIKKRKTKGLVISGGGAYGAMGVGTLARMNKSYQHIVGVSTGALMSPLVALKEWNILKEAYTSVSQEDIIDKSRWFEPSTFHDDGKVNILNLLYKQVKGDISAGSSNALRETIDKFITEEQFEKIISK
jgi:predicted acylesterase/phospholipase RssA